MSQMNSGNRFDKSSGKKLIVQQLKSKMPPHQILTTIDEKITNLKVTALPTDLSPVNQTIKNGIEDLKKIVSAQPKNIVREFHFHLFPKINIKEYYQTYSKFTLFVTIFALALGLISFTDKWIEGYNQRQEELQQFQLNEKNNNQSSGQEIKKNKFESPPVNHHTLKLKQKKINEIQTRTSSNKKSKADSQNKDTQRSIIVH